MFNKNETVYELVRVSLWRYAAGSEMHECDFYFDPASRKVYHDSDDVLDAGLTRTGEGTWAGDVAIVPIIGLDFFSLMMGTIDQEIDAIGTTETFQNDVEPIIDSLDGKPSGVYLIPFGVVHSYYNGLEGEDYNYSYYSCGSVDMSALLAEHFNKAPIK